MSLTDDDLKAIQSLLLPLENRIVHLEAEMKERFNNIDQNFDALFKRDETREQEYLVITNQLANLEQRVEKLEKKIA